MLWFSLVEVIWQWWPETVSRLPDSLCRLSDSLHCMPWQLPCFSYSFTLLLHWIYDKAESFSTLKKHIWWAQTKLANINWEIWGSFVPTILLIISESVIPRVILIHKTLGITNVKNSNIICLRMFVWAIFIRQICEPQDDDLFPGLETPVWHVKLWWMNFLRNILPTTAKRLPPPLKGDCGT